MFLSRIWVYPIKSLDGVAVESARIAPGGSLEHDRRFALVDATGKFVNAKRTAAIHRVRSAFSDDLAEVALGIEGDARRAIFALREPAPLERWFGEFFGFPVRLQENADTGFPDDLVAAGPTVVSEASLAEVAAWFPGTNDGAMRGRFRPNLELAGRDLAFAEDALFGAPGELRPFRVGAVNFLAHNPCQRCVVPTRDPLTGEAITGFQRHFIGRRAAGLPAWAARERFDHFYRFAVNTSVPRAEAGKVLRVGDPLEQ